MRDAAGGREQRPSLVTSFSALHGGMRYLAGAALAHHRKGARRAKAAPLRCLLPPPEGTKKLTVLNQALPQLRIDQNPAGKHSQVVHSLKLGHGQIRGKPFDRSKGRAASVSEQQGVVPVPIISLRGTLDVVREYPRMAA